MTSSPQTIVDFLKPSSTNLSTATYSVVQGVFDSQITQSSQQLYTDLMSYINGILTRGMNQLDGSGNPIPGTAGTSPTDSEIISINHYLTALEQWSRAITVDPASGQQISNFNSSGVYQLPSQFSDPVTGNTVSQVTSTMDQYMAQALDKMLRTFRSLGWDITAPTFGFPVPATTRTNTLAAISTLQSDSTRFVYNIDQQLAYALQASQNANVINQKIDIDKTSLQQMLMVDYVSTGNQTLYDEMAGLNSAIQNNNQALSFLNSLQDLMNQKDPQKFVLALNNLNTWTVNTLSSTSYDTFESQSFNQTLGATPKFSTSDLQTYIQNLSSTDGLITNTFTDQASTNVSQTITYSVQQIVNNLNTIISQLQANSASKDLVNNLKVIVNDFSSLPNATSTDPTLIGKAIAQWVQDTVTGNEGDYQNHLNNAITSSQSFNDTERENLRQVMFTFEEFYKSATGLLSRLTQLIEKIADALARS